ncbi:MAG: hypothetical protein WB579_25365 [Bryobacteraceae bacterium]
MDSQVFYKFGPTVLISIVTYFGGLFTEPAKKWLSNRAERKRLRRALYAEMAANLTAEPFLTYVSGIQDPANYPRFAFEQMFRTEVYQEALKQPILFREIREAKTFSLLYEGLARARTLPEAEQMAWLQKLNNEVLPFSVKQGRLSRRLLGWPHPLAVRWRKTYWHVISRNLASYKPEEYGGKMGFQPPRNPFALIRALWKGIPGDPI